MTCQLKHSNGIWKVYNDHMACRIDIVTEDSIGFFQETIAHIERKNEHAEANAEFIVKACNNHDALVKALGDICGQARLGDHITIRNYLFEQAMNTLADVDKEKL
jgi:hypothetical protein